MEFLRLSVTCVNTAWHKVERGVCFFLLLLLLLHGFLIAAGGEPGVEMVRWKAREICTFSSFDAIVVFIGETNGEDKREKNNPGLTNGTTHKSLFPLLLSPAVTTYYTETLHIYQPRTKWKTTRAIKDIRCVSLSSGTRDSPRILARFHSAFAFGFPYAPEEGTENSKYTASV